MEGWEGGNGEGRGCDGVPVLPAVATAARRGAAVVAREAPVGGWSGTGDALPESPFVGAWGRESRGHRSLHSLTIQNRLLTILFITLYLAATQIDQRGCSAWAAAASVWSSNNYSTHNTQSVAATLATVLAGAARTGA